MDYRPASFHLHHSLPFLSGLLIVLSVLFLPLSRGSVLADVPEIIVPLGISLGIAIYSVRLLRADYDADRVGQIALYGWTGAIVSAVGIWVLFQQLPRGFAVVPLFDETLTVMSVGSGIGLFLGAHVVHEHRSVNRRQSDRDFSVPPDRTRLLTEIVWAGEPQPNSILVAIVTGIAELEGVDPLDVEPLYEHINPNVFTHLRAQEGTRWRLRFFTDQYEIRVSSHGTVAIYDAEKPDEETDAIHLRGRER